MVARTIVDQAVATGRYGYPALSRDEVLDRLAKCGAPDFAEVVRLC